MLQELLQKRYNKTIEECSNQEIYVALLNMVKEKAEEKVEDKEEKKKLYYVSAEFLIGKLLSNNLINLQLYSQIADELKQHGKNLSEIEEVELEPSLGNGGLGRLAACFLDSIATLGLNGDGIGLNYHLGLFKQVFKDKCQTETPNPWIDDKSWLTKRDERYTVEFGDFTVTSTLYDIAVTGYGNRTNQLHLFDIDSVDEAIVKDGIDFDKSEVVKNLTLFLYPDDSDEAGRLLRVYQQYFMVSNGAQLILQECKAKGCKLTDLHEYAAVQINDTHPTMIIPELIRLLVKEGVSMDDAIDTVSKTCAYTNHTILAEALEKWPLEFIEKVAPSIVPIIKELDKRVREKYTDESVYIIDEEDRVHMAHIDMHYGYSINGVAYLHTEILKNNELNNFYKIYPEKFNNKTNGITFRRWLLHCNHELTALIENLIGDEFKKDAMELKKLLAYKDNEEVLNKLLSVKQQKKHDLAVYLKETQGIEIDENSIYDIQIKRLHEYKRQQMNAIYAIHKYLSIKAGNKPDHKVTMIFGAKAAPAYTTAKDIIHLLLCLQNVINNDPEVNEYLKVVMVQNYNVTLAEKLIPACDISEQISLASKEASGTGNMKFMLNGAITLGTSDGANVEIHDLVGDDNIYTFGESSEEVIERYERADYSSIDYYINDKEIKKALDFIISDTMLETGNPEILKRLFKELMVKDWFMTFPDCEDYFATKERAFNDYADRDAWAKKMIVNIANAGFFSSDRTIAEYNKDIWKLTK
ncbi:MAG: glycogen/starch/alpha-glucan phosphorylase [bacterium]|nr:glycogen/starch/alpha-glucan phosphorylase [bacterium]